MLYNVKEVSKCLGINIHLVYKGLQVCICGKIRHIICEKNRRFTNGK